jgi:alanine racemase
VLIGEGLEVGAVAELAGTIHHEIVSRLGPRLRREYVFP